LAFRWSIEALCLEQEHRRIKVNNMMDSCLFYFIIAHSFVYALMDYDTSCISCLISLRIFKRIFFEASLLLDSEARWEEIHGHS
jgi:hypothetical protein